MACLIALCSLTFAACGGGTSQLETPGALNAVSGTLIDGNINAGEGGLQASMLVFAFADLPERADVSGLQASMLVVRLRRSTRACRRNQCSSY